MNAKQALAWVKKCGIAVESAHASVPGLAQVVAGEPVRGELVGTSEKKRYIPALAIDSQLSRRFGVPTSGWENYLRSSASVARPRQVSRPVLQAEACGGEGSAHANGQTQTAGHSIFPSGCRRKSWNSRRSSPRKRPLHNWRPSVTICIADFRFRIADLLILFATRELRLREPVAGDFDFAVG